MAAVDRLEWWWYARALSSVRRTDGRTMISLSLLSVCRRGASSFQAKPSNMLYTQRCNQNVSSKPTAAAAAIVSYLKKRKKRVAMEMGDSGLLISDTVLNRIAFAMSMFTVLFSLSPPHIFDRCRSSNRILKENKNRIIELRLRRTSDCGTGTGGSRIKYTATTTTRIDDYCCDWRDCASSVECDRAPRLHSRLFFFVL